MTDLCMCSRLNDLSIASRVHILEPQWNPSVELQAIGRVLRLGQEQEVCVIRYIMEDTLETVRNTCAQLMRLKVC
jgi:SNF2 family DNA or RNA helicase